jgi:hypothetical protein
MEENNKNYNSFIEEDRNKYYSLIEVKKLIDDILPRLERIEEKLKEIEMFTINCY